MALIEDFPQVFFGEVTEEPFDWRAEASDENDEDDDVPASDDLIAQLGFDPDDKEVEDAIS